MLDMLSQDRLAFPCPVRKVWLGTSCTSLSHAHTWTRSHTTENICRITTWSRQHTHTHTLHPLQVQEVFEQLHKLRTLLFMPTNLGAPLQPLAPSIAPEAGALLSEAVRGLSQLAGMLTGPATTAAATAAGYQSGGEGPASPSGAEGRRAGPQARHAAVAAAAAGAAAAERVGHVEQAEMERAALLDELVRLRAELRMSFERNENATTATALELQQVGRRRN